MTCPCYAVLGDNRHQSIMGTGRCAAPCIADAAPILTALDAVVIVAGTAGERRIPMQDFYVWSGETRVAANEIIRGIEIPRDPTPSTQHFDKVAGWDGDFADASVAINLSWDGAHLATAWCHRTAAGPGNPNRSGAVGRRPVGSGHPSRSPNDRRRRPAPFRQRLQGPAVGEPDRTRDQEQPARVIGTLSPRLRAGR